MLLEKKFKEEAKPEPKKGWFSRIFDFY